MWLVVTTAMIIGWLLGSGLTIHHKHNNNQKYSKNKNKEKNNYNDDIAKTTMMTAIGLIQKTKID